MLKNISTLGSPLNKSEQQRIQGGDKGCKGCYDANGICIPFEHMLVIPHSCW
ncbi:hypothetical protein TPENAI_60811 [Tenacibaculum litopenaei]|jgi:hypothetical protein